MADVNFDRSSFLSPHKMECRTSPLSRGDVIRGDADFRGYGNEFPDEGNKVPKAAKELPEEFAVTGTASLADSYVKVINRDSTFGELITRNSSVGFIKERCSAKRADFSDTPSLQQVGDGFCFDELKIARSPNIVFGTGHVGVLIVPDSMSAQDLKDSPNLKNIRYEELFTETEWRVLHEPPPRKITCNPSEKGTQAMKEQYWKRETSVPCP